MEIYLDKLDSITQTKYQEFKEKVEELLAFYQETDPERYNLVKDKIEQVKARQQRAISNQRESQENTQNI